MMTYQNAWALVYLGLALLVMSGLTACKNTAHGAGEDIEHMGEKIQDKTD